MNDNLYMVQAANNCPEILLAFNLPSKTWLYVNPAVRAATGYTVEELTVLPLNRLLTSSSYAALKKSVRKLSRLSTGSDFNYQVNNYEMQIVCKDGLEKWLEAYGKCISNEQGELVFTGSLRESNKARLIDEKHENILNSIEEGYYEADLSGRLIFYNEALCSIFGYSRAEFANLDQQHLYKDRHQLFKYFREVYQSGQPEKNHIMEITRKDGNSGTLEISITPVKDQLSTVTGFRGLVRDVTDRERMRKQLEYFSMHDKLTGLYNRTYFEEELRRLSKGRDYPITMISADLNGLKLINDTLGHDKGDLLLKAAANVLKLSLRGSDVLARVGGDEFTAILTNTDEATADKVLKRIRYNVKDFSDNNPDLYLSISLGMATAMSNETSHSELFKQADDSMYRDKFSPSTLTRNKIVKSLMDALADRDYVADGHCKRVAILSREMATRLSLSPKQQADLALLAQVHDLGKVAIPDKVVFKKGPLSRDEWKIIKEHPEKGHRIALSSNYLTGVASLILKHHERWDGSGYPSSIKGREIPIECRIFSIVDAYDAMTNKREYNVVKSPAEALEEIKTCAGTQFDPALVDTFVSIIEEQL